MQLDTRQRLINAGAHVFAERGFQGATIQEIARRAEANIAAVNYHFGGKAGLYAEVLGQQIEARREPPPSLADDPDNPAAQLRAFIGWLLPRVCGPATQFPLGQMQLHEMAAASPVLDKVVELLVRPQLTALREIVRALLPSNASDEVVRRHTLSVIAQCVFYHHGAPVLERVFPEVLLDDAEVAALSDHIATFSLAALRRAHDRAAT